MHNRRLALGLACLLLATPFIHSETRTRKNSKTNKGVDLNTGSQAELEAVPGIGKERALKIIAGRPYSSVRDLKTRAAFTSQELLAVSTLVKVSSPAPAAPVPSAPAAKAPGGEASSPDAPGTVWVNLDTKVFHRQGDKYYGKTKHGVYMAETEAVADGYRAAKMR